MAADRIGGLRPPTTRRQGIGAQRQRCQVDHGEQGDQHRGERYPAQLLAFDAAGAAEPADQRGRRHHQHGDCDGEGCPVGDQQPTIERVEVERATERLDRPDHRPVEQGHDQQQGDRCDRGDPRPPSPAGRRQRPGRGEEQDEAIAGDHRDDGGRHAQGNQADGGGVGLGQARSWCRPGPPRPRSTTGRSRAAASPPGGGAGGWPPPPRPWPYSPPRAPGEGRRDQDDQLGPARLAQQLVQPDGTTRPTIASAHSTHASQARRQRDQGSGDIAASVMVLAARSPPPVPPPSSVRDQGPVWPASVSEALRTAGRPPACDHEADAVLLTVIHPSNADSQGDFQTAKPYEPSRVPVGAGQIGSRPGRQYLVLPMCGVGP